MKAIKRKYLDKKYLHDIDKWEEDTRNRVNTATSIASSCSWYYWGYGWF